MVLTRLGFDNFVVRLNHRKVLSALLEANGVPEPQHAAALVAIDKLDKIGAGGVVADLAARGISADSAARLLDAFAGGDDTFSSVGAALAGHPAGTEALEQLRTIVRLSAETGAGPRIRVDPSLARGLSYYTGAIMEIAVPDMPGSLGGGGRYDNLVGMFLGRDLPACGFSLGLERIIVVMTERGMFPAKVSGSAVDVMVTFLADELRPDALKLASELRGEKLRVDVYPEASKKLDKALKYASSRSVPVLAILGEDEQARGEVTVRDLQTRQQEGTGRPTAASWIAKRVRIEER
jgi:histidyl-tRNA synthetase